MDEFGLSDYDAEQLSKSIVLCECFEEAVKVCGSAKDAVNWILTDVIGTLKSKKMTTEMLDIDAGAFGQLILLVIEGKVGRANAKKILADMFDDKSINPEDYAKENGYIVSNDTSLIEKVVGEVIAADPKSVADYKGGKEKALMSLFGKCMKELRGNCDPQTLRQILIDTINK